ncbi:isoprenylcysteine carboxylmethyltransferase family protein [Alteromonadaceae bacterium M269]|nr:isoprenylcysteine carboxylmethyltransferase family protein [Alteromonadaceae bacterium M269]
MTALENKVPPPLICIFSALLMWWLSSLSAPFALDEAIRRALIFLFLGLGVIVCVAGIIEFKRVKTTVNPLKPETASSLVNSGVYRISRNPMYLGMALILLAFAVYLSSVISLLGIIVFVFYMNKFQIVPEEKAIEGLFGDDYILYKSKVRRWI